MQRETKIKICGIFREEDVAAINEAKPDFIGFIIGFPKSHRNITPEKARHFREMTDPDILTVGVFVDAPAEFAAELANTGVINIIQLHGHEDEEYISRLRSLTNAQIWKSFIIKDKEDVSSAMRSSADKILLDAGLGSGRTFDHSLLKDIKRDYILAGGLNESNLPDVISQLHPWAADISSGCETNKLKDKNKILRVAACRR